MYVTKNLEGMPYLGLLADRGQHWADWKFGGDICPTQVKFCLLKYYFAFSKVVAEFKWPVQKHSFSFITEKVLSQGQR